VTMFPHLILKLEAPLMALGGEAIDNYGVIRRFPAKSMITGMIANSLGVERYEREKLQLLQDKLLMGSLIERQDAMICDFQTAQLSRNDQGWTTAGRLEGRGGGAASYAAPHLRYRDYWTDACVHAAVRVAEDAPFGLDEIREALVAPARPIFLGRKACLPSTRVYSATVMAASIFDALLTENERKDGRPFRMQWPVSEPLPQAIFNYEADLQLEPICDERNWITGVHGGQRIVAVAELRHKRKEAVA
jgi:CRISPR system Cascade subunit CasD